MNHLSILTALAVILLGALVGGRLASLCRIPRVTGYLLVGLFAGPSFARVSGLPELITPEALKDLRLISDVALALILMNIGGQFRMESLRRWKSRIFLFSLGESGITFLLVAATGLGVNLAFLQKSVAGLTILQTSVVFGLLLGIIGVATAPAATLMVIREYEAEGPVTGTVLTLVGLNNLASILAFALAAHLLIRPGESLSLLAFRMLGPILIGGCLGFLLSIAAQWLELSSERKLLLLGGVAAVGGLSRVLDLDPMLASLALGMVLANSSPHWNRLVESLRQIDYPLYVAFFVLAGASLHLETLTHIGLLGVAYVLARTAGKLLGARIGARMGNFGERKRRCVGFTLLAQAGVAIGLAGTLARQCRAARHAGFAVTLVDPHPEDPAGKVDGFLPADVECPVPEIFSRVRTGLDTYILIATRGHKDDFLVVREALSTDARFIGMINYTEIRNLLFEPSLSGLVVAGDLVSPLHQAIGPDQPLREALKTMQLNRDISYFPVADRDEPNRLLGIISQNDVMATFRRPEKS
ncbi:MAG: cation:proton antiporter [Desulfuromonadales bacterium]